jgi:hypothetical protein
MELLHWQKTANVDYAVATYWYGMDGATANGELTPAGARVKVGDLTGWSAAGEGEE